MNGLCRIGKRGIAFWARLIFSAVFLLVLALATRAQVFVTVSFAPPELPVYEQPPCPGDNYIWTPGYWAWDGDDYYWVPGTWVMAPEVGYLWTPGYWGYGNAGYVWYPGYWGPQVGFYGGIVYGYGYYGHGYEGGRWDRGHFYYNREVNNVNVTVVHNVYNTTVVNRNDNVTRVSYNGGRGGVNARPTSQEQAATREPHVTNTPAQTQHIEAAREDRQLSASANQGKPPVAASAKPAELSGRSVVAAREGGRYTPPPNHSNDERSANRPAVAPANRENTAPPTRPVSRNAPLSGSNNTIPATPVHPNDLPPMERPDHTNNNGNDATSNAEQKYRQQQEKMMQKQAQERQKLQQQQDKEHQRIQKQQADQAKQQQMEQRHQQQTQQMQQKQEQQQHSMQQKQHPALPPPQQHQNPPPHPNSPQQEPQH